MTLRRAAGLLAAIALATAACTGAGGSPSPAAGGPCPATPAPDPANLEAWSPASQTPTIFPQVINPAGTIACGPTRFMFSFLDAANALIAAPDRTATVRLFDLGSDPKTPVITADGTFIWAIEGSVGVYVANVDFPTSGLWGAEFVTAAAGGSPDTIRLQFDVQPESVTTAIGDPAPASDTPTLADVGGDVSKISTDGEPRTSFYETSVADALAAKKPFVLIFATPKFCVSAQCGPTLDRMKPIAAAHPEMTFINVEPYQLKSIDGQLQPVLTGDPAQLTLAQASEDWRLVAEPWIFVVDRDGIVTGSFLLIVGNEEIEAAIAAVE